MLKSLLLSLIFFCNLFSQEIVIKSLHYYVNNEKYKLPIMKFNSRDRLRISFEIEAEYEPNIDILFKYCDKDWEPYDDILIQGISPNIHYNPEIKPLPASTDGADYYVIEKYPNRDVKFNRSGKWMFYIIDAYDDEIIYDYGKFFVINNIVELNTEITKWRREGTISSNNANDRVLNIKTGFTLPDSLDPFRITHVEIVKNFAVEYPYLINKDSYSKYSNYEWNGANEFLFIHRNIQPGNEYRQTNLLNRNRYTFPQTRAQFDGIEYSRFYKLGKSDHNGGFRLMNFKNKYSDYLITTFEFKPHEDFDKDIFIVGAFTNWEVLPWYKLNNRNDVYSISLELKRGVYDYQYVLGDIDEEKVVNIDWTIFEGNFWDTKNVYSIFLYYKSPNFGEFDKIIGFEQIVR